MLKKRACKQLKNFKPYSVEDETDVLYKKAAELQSYIKEKGRRCVVITNELIVITPQDPLHEDIVKI